MKSSKLWSLPILALLLLGRQQSIDEVYLIPRDFHGYVAIVFNVKEGEKEDFENGARVYKIPADGLLLTQAKFNDTWHQAKYFFVAEGKRIAIPETPQAEPDILKGRGIKDYDVFLCCQGSSGVGDYNTTELFVGTFKELKATPDAFLPMTFRQRMAQKLERTTGKKVSL